MKSSSGRSDGVVGVRMGTTRMVVLIGQWAIKLPTVRRWRLFLHGLLANMQEREWAGVDERLCPVLWASMGGWVVVMRRAAPLADAEWAGMDAARFVAFCALPGGGQLPVEYKRCSLGRVGDRIVAVDYGS